MIKNGKKKAAFKIKQIYDTGILSFAFTLIECERPEKASESSPVKSPESANCSFHAYSLTAGECGDARTGCAVTKPREGKPAGQGGLRPAPKALTGNGEEQIAGRLTKEEQGTRNQSGRQGKNTGRRQTNIRKHRKGNPAGITGRAGDFGKGRLSVRYRKSAIIREENGQMHLMARRCKRRRHVWKDSLSSRREPVWSRQRVSESIRRNAESWNEAVQGVGDGRSSENGKDNITLPMQRAISLRMCPTMKRPADDCPKGSTHPVKSRARINQGTLYPTANADGTENDVCRMRKDESQGESRTWENCIFGLVYGVKAIPCVRSAFTLVELLTVIALIAILTSMLMPALKSARFKSQQIVCTGNLKQVGVGMFLFSGDNADNLPSVYSTEQEGTFWFKTLDAGDYLKDNIDRFSLNCDGNSGENAYLWAKKNYNTYTCPSNEQRYCAFIINYAMNFQLEWYYGIKNEKGAKLGKIPKPGSTVLASDSYSASTIINNVKVCGYNYGSSNYLNNIGLVHRGVADVLRTDGSVSTQKSFTTKDLY